LMRCASVCQLSAVIALILQMRPSACRSQLHWVVEWSLTIIQWKVLNKLPIMVENAPSDHIRTHSQHFCENMKGMTI
jgi:hypothetical protein